MHSVQRMHARNMICKELLWPYFSLELMALRSVKDGGAAVLQAGLLQSLVLFQGRRCEAKDHLAAVVLKVRLHCQGHAKLFGKERLHWRLAEVHTHASALGFCQVSARINESGVRHS